MLAPMKSWKRSSSRRRLSGPLVVTVHQVPITVPMRARRQRWAEEEVAEEERAGVADVEQDRHEAVR